MRKVILLLFIVVGLAMNNFSKEFIYSITLGDVNYKETLLIEEVDSKLLINVDNEKYGNYTYLTTSNYNTLKTELSINKDPYEIELKESEIVMTKMGVLGELEKKDIWMQCIFNINSIIERNKKKTPFYMVNFIYDENNQVDLEQVKRENLLWVNKGKEKVTVNNEKHEAVKMILTLDDFRGLFWKAEYWYRLSDGQLLKYSKPTGGPGSPIEQGILVSEK